jgi:hypothetical protein
MYSKFYQFGNRINSQIQQDTNAANPLTYCLVPSLSSQFFHGSSSANQLYSNSNAPCMNFMAQRCRLQWDDYCDAYMTINTDNYWPNMAVIDSLAYQNGKQFFNIQPTVGQDLLRNTCYLKFIETSDLPHYIEQFDPNVANSPMIKTYQEFVNRYSKVIHLNDTTQINNDRLIQKMLENYQICIDVIGRIYLGWIRQEEGIQLKNTIIEHFFQQNSKLLNLYVQQAIERIPSFQKKGHHCRC